MPDAAGPVFVTSYDGPNLSTTVLTVLDLAGTVLWRREFDGHPSPPRVSADGTVWIAHRGSGRHLLSELDADGSVLRSIAPQHESYEHLGAFVLLPDGICVAWVPAERGQVVSPGPTARIARYDDNGTCRWSTPAVLDTLFYPGLVGMSPEARALVMIR